MSLILILNVVLLIAYIPSNLDHVTRLGKESILLGKRSTELPTETSINVPVISSTTEEETSDNSFITSIFAFYHR